MSDKRGSGRTKKMVMSLPDNSGAFVIVHSRAMWVYVDRMIRDLKKSPPERHFRILVVDSPFDVDRLRGHSLPIFVDHAFWELARPVAREALAEFLASRAGRI